MGFLYIEVDGTLPTLSIVLCRRIPAVQHFLEHTACGVRSPIAPFHDLVIVAEASVCLRLTPNVVADCVTNSDDRRCLLSLPRRKNSRNDAVTGGIAQWLQHALVYLIDRKK